MKNIIPKEMRALQTINTTARKEIDTTIKLIIKTKMEESIHKPTHKMITDLLVPTYFNRAGVPLDKKQLDYFMTRLSRDKVQLIVDTIRNNYSTIDQRKELIRRIEGIRAMNTNTYLKLKLEIYPRLHKQETIKEFFEKCTAIYQMQPANKEQIRQIKQIAFIPEVYEGLYSRGVRLDEHVDPVNGNILPSFDKVIMDKMNNEDASSFLQFYYTYKQQYDGIILSALERNTIKQLYTRLGETEKTSPIHLMYITKQNYNAVINELNERIRRNSVAQEQAYENRKLDQIHLSKRATEWDYENLRSTNKDLMFTKSLLKFVHIVWASLGENYKDDEELEPLLPYISISQREGGLVKDDSLNNQRKLKQLLRRKIHQATQAGTLDKYKMWVQHTDVLDYVYPDFDEHGNIIETVEEEA